MIQGVKEGQRMELSARRSAMTMQVWVKLKHCHSISALASTPGLLQARGRAWGLESKSNTIDSHV